MFGYIQPLKPEMKIKDYERFRAYYCGVCHAIAKRFGQMPRMALTYDAAFYALFLDALDRSSQTRFKMSGCFKHPAGKRLTAFQSVCLDYAADVNILLAWFHVKDKRQDGQGLQWTGAASLLKGAFVKSEKKHPALCDNIRKQLAVLDRLEKENSSNIDEVSDSFACITRDIASPSFIALPAAEKEAVQWLGYNLGKWLYLVDAFDDMKKDFQKKAYNPFLLRYGFDSNKQTVEDYRIEIREQAEFIMLHCLDQVAKAFELLSITKNRDIIENIIYMGMLNKTDIVLQGVKNEKSV